MKMAPQFPAQQFFDPAVIKPGDLIGFSGEGFTGDIINLGTYGIPRWGICHVGIMGEANDGRLLLFESTTLDDLPCEISGVRFNGTQAHQLDAVLQRYRGKVWHYPLYRSLYEFERQRLTQFLMGTIHVPYGMMEAFRSAGIGLSCVESLLRKQDLHRIYCSEWCAAAHAFIGIMPTANVGRWSPNHLVRHCRAHGVLQPPQRLE
jgi:hypothetical protein